MGPKGISDNPLKIEFCSLSKSEIDDFHDTDIFISKQVCFFYICGLKKWKIESEVVNISVGHSV